MKLSKRLLAKHSQAELLLEKEILSYDEKVFVYENWNEAANHDVSHAGAFFTPNDLAFDAVIEVECFKKCRVIDLCAGIGSLSFALLQRNPDADIVCVESNPDYVRIGKKLLPEATWICSSILDFSVIGKLGFFDYAISNPPFGNVPTLSDNIGHYTGKNAEFKVIELARYISKYGVFIMPSGSVPFRYSGSQFYEEIDCMKSSDFEKQTGIKISIGVGIDTTFYSQFKNTKIKTEVAVCDFEELTFQHDLMLA